MKKRVAHNILLVLVLVVAIVPMVAAETFVLSSSRWSKAQDDAVVAAGGSVDFRHASGVGVASSDSPNFSSALRASGQFQSVEPDMIVQWQAPLQTFEMEELATTVNTANDTFWDIQWAPKAVEAPAAWAAGYTGTGVRVAVLDGGIFAAHPDLAANMDVASSRSFVPVELLILIRARSGTARTSLESSRLSITPEVSSESLRMRRSSG